MKCIITGGAGFIGSHLVEQLPDYVGLDLKSKNDILTCKLPEADMVVHLAALSTVLECIDDPLEAVRQNIEGTVRLAQHYKDKRFIFISSGGEIQETVESPYGMTKYAAEELVKFICKDYVILRLANVYGADGSHSVVEKFLNGDIEIFGDGSSRRTYVHVSDIVRGIISAQGWSSGTYTLGRWQNLPVLSLAKATGKEIKFGQPKLGERRHSRVKTSAPLWKPKINVLDYIKEQTA